MSDTDKHTLTERRSSMPLINIKVLKGTLSDEKKAEMIKRVSETVAEIEAGPEAGDKLVPHTWCLVKEYIKPGEEALPAHYPNEWPETSNYPVTSTGNIYRLNNRIPFPHPCNKSPLIRQLEGLMTIQMDTLI
jgi:hypothetical protein